MQQLRGREGARIKKIYKAEAKRTGVTWAGRVYQPGDAFAAGDDINRLLSAGHACLYAICHAAIVGLGASPALGFVHTGGATSFVLDIADLYKAETTIPLAFDLAAAHLTSERDIRTAFRDTVASGKLMSRIVHDIKKLLLDDGCQIDDSSDEHHLWDEVDGTVPGGINWANQIAASWQDDSLIGITHPNYHPHPTGEHRRRAHRRATRPPQPPHPLACRGGARRLRWQPQRPRTGQLLAGARRPHRRRTSRHDRASRQRARLVLSHRRPHRWYPVDLDGLILVGRPRR